MKARPILERVKWLGAIDWDRRLFDALIPLPDGTSYNAYLVEGSQKTVLLDTVDPPMTEVLLRQLESVPRIDYVVSQHAEQDHAGAIPAVLARYPEAELLCSKKARGMLLELLDLDAYRIRVVEDGEALSLGDRSLKFIYTPWVHWPETMVSYLQEDRVLFSCDFFGSHIAASELFVADPGRVLEAAKRYFAEIMMPFRAVIAKNLEKLEGYPVDLIAPSHGQVYGRPSLILDAYRDWVLGEPRNLAVLAYVSMHGSTRRMVDRLAGALVERGVEVESYSLPETDIGKLAMSLVDAGTIVIGTPTVLTGPHPAAAYAAVLANALRPKARFLSIIGSYGWGGKAVETLASLVPRLEVEVLDPVLCMGLPGEADEQALDALAEKIAAKHAEQGFAKRSERNRFD
ncbi:MAG: FprA family A-type flavoprotein [Deltaproteobacteria bacterium]|nr:FprA family A-type flavoprotein [Deltaproteobacteria bacterium]